MYYQSFKVMHRDDMEYLTLFRLHSDSQSSRECLLVCLYVCVCSPGCFINQNQSSSWWVGSIRSISPSFLDPDELRDIASSHPCREFDSGSPDWLSDCAIFQGREEAMICFISADTGSLSSVHEALTPHCVVVMLLLLLFGCHGAGRCPGQSRGFAFVEFNLIQEATRWMETNQVTLPYTDTNTQI